MEVDLAISTPYDRIVITHNGETLNFIINKDEEVYHEKNSSFNKRTEYIKQYKGWFVGNLNFIDVMYTANLLDENLCDVFVIGYEYNYWGERMKFTEKTGIFFKEQYFESDGPKKRVPREVKHLIKDEHK